MTFLRGMKTHRCEYLDSGMTNPVYSSCSLPGHVPALQETSSACAGRRSGAEDPRLVLANNCVAFRPLQHGVRLRETVCTARAGGDVDVRARNAAGMGNTYVQA